MPKNTLEGRLQRQLVLHKQKIGIPDPMEFVKQLTSQHLLQGSLPQNALYTQGELDALVAAYTAWQAATHPNQVTSLGDASGGVGGPAGGRVKTPLLNKNICQTLKISCAKPWRMASSITCLVKGSPCTWMNPTRIADPEWELAYRMLKESGYSLPWIETIREIEKDIEAAREDLQIAWKCYP